MSLFTSDALPVRLWINGVETFNEERPFNQQFKKFAQKFNLTDHIVLQIRDTEEKAYSIVIKNDDDEELEEIAAVKEEVEGMWYYSWDFTFDEYALVDGCYYLELYSTGITGTGAVSLLLIEVAGEGTVGIFVQIEGDGDIDLLVPEIAGEGENYPFNSEEFRLSDTQGGVCGAAPITLYYSGVWGVGTIMYTEKEFINWPVGYNYIDRVSGSTIHQYNDSNGTVGADTLVNC